MLPYSAPFGTTVATCYVSLQRPGNFTHFLHEGGLRILIRRSIRLAGFAGYDAPRGAFLDKLFSPVVVQRQVAVLVQTVLRVVRGDSTGAVLGRGYCHYDRFHFPDTANCLEVSQLQLILKDVDISYCGAPRGPGEIPQLPYSWWFMSLLCSSTSLSKRRGFFSWSRLFVGPQKFTSCLTRLSMSLLHRLCISSSLSWRRGGFPWSQAVLRTMFFPQLQFIDKVFDVPVCRSSRFPRVQVMRGEIPQLQLVVFLLGQCCCMPVVCNDRCLVVQSAL